MGATVIRDKNTQMHPIAIGETVFPCVSGSYELAARTRSCTFVQWKVQDGQSAHAIIILKVSWKSWWHVYEIRHKTVVIEVFRLTSSLFLLFQASNSFCHQIVAS